MPDFFATVSILVEFSVEGYLADLIEKGTTYVFHQNMKAGRARFGKKKETYVFPNTPAFAGLQGVVRNHPDTAFIGTVLTSQVIHGSRSLVLEFDAKGAPDGNFGVEVSI